MNHNQEVREQVLASVSNVTNEQLNEKLPGKWSIMQVLEHLYLMERSIVHQMKIAMASDEETEVEDKPIQLSTNRAHKIVAPPFVTPSDSYITLEEIKEKLAESRAALEAFAAQADEEKMKKRSFTHPVFGALHVKQWVEFIGWHEKRHVAQIEELKHELG